MKRNDWTVYGWLGYRLESDGHRGQTREIVAAHSKSDAARRAGYKYPSQMFNLAETGNAVEIAVAMNCKTRGHVCWKPIREQDPLAWKRVAPKGEK